MKGWGITEETELLRILKHIDELGFKFILSNVLEHKEKKNELLTQWIEEHHYRVIDEQFIFRRLYFKVHQPLSDIFTVSGDSDGRVELMVSVKTNHIWIQNESN